MRKTEVMPSSTTPFLDSPTNCITTKVVILTTITLMSYKYKEINIVNDVAALKCVCFITKHEVSLFFFDESYNYVSNCSLFI